MSRVIRGERLPGRPSTHAGTSVSTSLIPGGIGFVLFTYGRKQERLPHIGAGIAYMVYPYFTPGVWSMLLVGVGLGIGLWIAVRAGW